MTVWRRLASGLLVAALAGVPVPGFAAAAGLQEQGRGAGRQGRSGTGVSVAEAERLFDRYALGQARVALQLTADQLVRFGQRFERLQVAQRQRQRQRQRRLADLAAAGRNGQADEAAVADLLDAIDRESVAADEQVRVARERLEEVLSVRQRARFRAFEARMERERLRLISRAREEARRAADTAAVASGGESTLPAGSEP